MMEAEAVVAQGTLKATCSRDELTRALGIVSRGVSTRTTVQILAGILLQASGEKLDLAATDMELSLRTSLEAQVEAEGSVVVPGRLLLELARLLPGEEVSIGELAHAVASVVGFRGRVEFDASKPDGTPRKLLDVSRLTKLGWTARTPLREGLAHTYQHYLGTQGKPCEF